MSHPFVPLRPQSANNTGRTDKSWNRLHVNQKIMPAETGHGIPSQS
jgi:hypothetical protein